MYCYNVCNKNTEYLGRRDSPDVWGRERKQEEKFRQVREMRGHREEAGRAVCDSRRLVEMDSLSLQKLAKNKPKANAKLS